VVEETAIDADFHEMKESAEAVYLLGLISFQWNMVEHHMSTLIWNYAGGYELGASITAGLGNQTRGEVLLSLSRKAEKNRELQDRIEFIAKAFRILRENRNILMHSHSIEPHPTGKLAWRRTSGKPDPLHVTSLLEVSDLDKILSEISALGLLIVSVYIHANPNLNRAAVPLMPMFTLPTKLTTQKD
jgi:hypothetical protein